MYIIGGVKIAGNLEINVFYMIVNHSNQLSYTRGIFFIYDTSLDLDGERWSWVWDLRRVP